MYPHERSLEKKFAEKPFAIVGVNSDPRERLKAVLKKENMTWRSFLDGGSPAGPIATRWNVTGWPTIYVLDQKGVVRHKDLRGDDLERAIEGLLGKIGARRF